tara:strand:+ start:968 stop:1489 length:522 start_codon:yes stop_codon:yes gene_type:complete
MVDDKQKHQTIFSTPFDNAKSNYIFGSSTPGHTIHEQNRWEEAGGRGAFPVMNDETYSSIMNYDPTNPHSREFPLRQNQNPSFYSLGDFRYRGKNPAFNPGEPWELYNRDIDASFSPAWLEAKNKTYGLPGTEVAQSKWKEKFQSIIDMIMSRKGLDERDAKKYIFDNYGLAV